MVGKEVLVRIQSHDHGHTKRLERMGLTVDQHSLQLVQEGLAILGNHRSDNGATEAGPGFYGGQVNILSRSPTKGEGTNTMFRTLIASASMSVCCLCLEKSQAQWLRRLYFLCGNKMTVSMLSPRCCVVHTHSMNTTSHTKIRLLVWYSGHTGRRFLGASQVHSLCLN